MVQVGGKHLQIVLQIFFCFFSDKKITSAVRCSVVISHSSRATFSPIETNVVIHILCGREFKRSNEHLYHVGHSNGNSVRIIVFRAFVRKGRDSKLLNRRVRSIKCPAVALVLRRRVANPFWAFWERFCALTARAKTRLRPSSTTAWVGNACFGSTRVSVRIFIYKYANYFV